MKFYRFGIALVVGLLLLASGTGAAEQVGKTVVLFDGTNTNGWNQAGPGSFEFKDGMLTSHGGMGLFWYDHEFSDFVLELDWKASTKDANSGVFVRFPNPGNDPWVAVNHGHEIQICDTEPHFQTGAIYNFKNPTEIASKPPGEWNHYVIKVEGQHYTVTLNGKVVNEFDSPDRPLHGYIGIQNHPPESVSFRNIKVTELSPAEPATKSAFAPIDLKGTMLEPGVVAEYYKDVKSLDALPGVDATPFLVRVENNINYKNINGQFENSKLANEFGARWTGYLKIDNPIPVGFMLRSDDAARFYLNDRLVIDNSNWEAMKDHELLLNLVPGVYKVRVDFQNGAGSSTCQLYWKEEADNPSKPLPQSWLFHAQGAETAVKWDNDAWEKTVWSQSKWAEKYGPIYDKMDYGPFFSATVKCADDNYADKGLAILVNKDPDATMLFDTELLRYAGGWFGGFLDNHGVVFNGQHGVNPGPDGQVIFQSPAVPGCAVGDEPQSDPRPRPYGPLPSMIGHYRGLYLHGDQVILSYTVGDRAFLETPSMRMAGENPVFIRTLHATASDQPTLLLVGAMSRESA